MIDEALLRPYARVFEEQQAYYEARAAEYDQWWRREGKYDQGPGLNQQIFANVESVKRAFDSLPLRGEVLEIAGGTGIWSEYLAKRATHLTVVDGSEAMLAENKDKLGKSGLSKVVEYRRADLLRWTPDKTYDAIFMSFFISHLPYSLLAPFFRGLVPGLKEGGVLVTLEGAGPGVLRTLQGMAKQGTFPEGKDIEVRTLNDGRKFRIIKRDDTKESLGGALEAAGLRAEAKIIGDQFLYGVGTKGGREHGSI